MTLAGISMNLLAFNIIMIITGDLNRELKSKNERKNKLYSIISHDLQGSISNISNYIFLLKTALNKNDIPKAEEHLSSIEKVSFSYRYQLENILYCS